MKEGQASQTAVLVCMGRAVAHGHTNVARFSDPTAMSLLPEDARARVEAFRAGAPPKTSRERFAHEYLRTRGTMMVARTVEIDDAVRGLAAPQVVILGAGLDGRAWRMPELRDAVVFEVDHPDSQRLKRERIAALTQTAKEVRFVPVDFTRDRLDDALAAAGHDPLRPTMWIWEGVVMYLARKDIESTLEVIRHRSTVGSRVSIVYHAPALMLLLVGLVLKRVGEPLRSVFKPKQLQQLLERYGLEVIRDRNLPEIARELSLEVRHTERLAHNRILLAELVRKN